MPTNSKVSSIDRQLIACVMAGVGGALPTLCNLATLVNSRGSENIDWKGTFLGIGLYSLIGLCLCAGFAEKRRREAFILGIAAPAVIASILNGTTSLAKEKPADNDGVAYFSLFNNANADTEDSFEDDSQSLFWISFRRALGFNVDAEQLLSENIVLQDQSDKLNDELRSAKEKNDLLEKNCSSAPALSASTKSPNIDSNPAKIEKPASCEVCPVCQSANISDRATEAISFRKEIIRYMGMNGLSTLASKQSSVEGSQLFNRVFSSSDYQVQMSMSRGGYDFISELRSLSGSCERYSEYVNRTNLAIEPAYVLYEIALSFPSECYLSNPEFAKKFEHAFVSNFFMRYRLGL